jgi:hypothetical protein
MKSKPVVGLFILKTHSLPFGFKFFITDYDLVRAHHPDSFHARLSTCNQAEAHSRFRSIKAAYDFLRGCTLSPDPNAAPPPSPQHFDPYLHELARRRRAYNASRDSDGFGKSQWAEGFGAPKPERGEWNENGKKERLILLCGVVVSIILLDRKELFNSLFYIGTAGRFISQSPNDTYLHNFPYFSPSIVYIPILPLCTIL